jgi:UDP-N-acetyl-D-glucosamine dehydrogenase
VDDTRESPAFKVIELLEERGALVDYNDPYIPKAPLTRKYKLDKESVELTPENLSAYDCVMIITDHSVYDAAFIEAHSRLIIDTRNVVKQASPKVVKA